MTSAPLDQLRTALADRYRLERELGQGGMATVYLAHDLRHERKVAIKVLRPELAAVIGAERFVREIRTIAALQHPHILGLIDSGEVQGTAYYVMPFVEGESLRARLVREKQLPVPDAVRIATEVASALDYAHRHGVIHRDIKPENILLHDGRALVADFGIALAVSQAGSSRMTETGMSLGTPFYMSPEQAMGEREITARSDVYALGAVLYELLTGDPPFTGSTAQAIVARVVTESPRPLMPQRHTIPPHVEAAVLTALEKLPADRFATAAQFAEALERPGAATLPTLSATARVPLAPSARKQRVAALAPWAIGAVAGVLAGAALMAWLRHSPEAPRRMVVRFGIQLPRDAEPVGARGSIIAFSPDGSQIVYIGKAPAAQQRLYVRRLDQPDPTPIPGTDGANLPFFSPDGQWLGFQQGTKLMKVPLGGGPISTIATVSGQASGATWTPGDTIVFGGDSGLMDVPASGGTPRLIAKPDTGETFTFPDALPDGHAVLFGISGHGALKLAVLDRRTNKVKRLRQDGGYPRYVNGGFVVLNDRTGITSAVPFDADRLEVTGAATSLAEKLGLSDDGDRNIGVSRTGDFAYQVSTRQGVRLIRVSRAGGTLDVGLDSAFYALPTVSPDGRRVAITRSAEDGFDHRDVWVLDLTQGTQSRVTFDTLAAWSIWSPDGRQIAYMKVAGTPTRTTLLIVPADGSGAPRVLLNQPGFWRPAAFEPGGRNLLFHGSSGGQGAQESIWRVGVDSGATPQQVLASPFSCNAPSLSPDGRWLTYATTESGRSEVYVRSYPGPGGRWQVSLGGGTEPIWSPVGNEIFYRAGDAVMAAAVRTQPSFEVTSRTKLFTGQYIGDNPGDQDYAVAPDGKSFYMLQVVTTSQQAIVVTLNLFEQLRARRK